MESYGVRSTVVSAKASRLVRIAKAYETHVIQLHQEPRLLATAAFLITFILTRLVTHVLLADRGGGGIEIGSLHVHHVVFGIVLLLVFGLLVIVDLIERARAIVFGVGAALVLDEFALVLNLADVYWAPQGRESIDAVVIFAAALVVIVLGGGFWQAAWREIVRR
jgi:hypothetical protein